MAWSSTHPATLAWLPRPGHWSRWLRFGLLVMVVLYASATTARIVARKYYVFLPDYVRWTLTPSPSPASPGPTHLLVLLADHFEPNRQLSTTTDWMERYRRMAARHADATGRRPQHTWFYPGEQVQPAILEVLRQATADRLGEVEFHFHHDFDTADAVRQRMQQALAQFATFGFNRTADGATHFAFVHGNFGLDNSNGPLYCGVPTELSLLRELGAFADFTFPSIYQDSQPRIVNTLFAAKDDSGPKSYDRPLPLTALRDGRADLMMFEGPLVFAPSLNPRRLFLELDDGDIHPGMPASPSRIPRWVRAGVHAPGRPEWLFIKLFAHGAGSPEDVEAVTGADFEQMLDALEHDYNDGREYVLHYITAREAYNIAMAAVDGHTGSPVDYLNYVIPPYLSSSPVNR